MTKVRTQIAGEQFTHKELWRCCQLQLTSARRRKRGQLYFHMSAMLMAYFAYEAYLNAAGSRVAPKDWSKERDFFNSKNYKGIDGKLKRICEVCDIPRIMKGKRPFQSIRHLEALRDFLVHGKPDTFAFSLTHAPSGRPTLHGYDRLTTLVSADIALRCTCDTKDFIEYLHGFVASKASDRIFVRKALGGILSHSTGRSSRA